MKHFRKSVKTREKVLELAMYMSAMAERMEGGQGKERTETKKKGEV